jgi:hypothetical protein
MLFVVKKHHLTQSSYYLDDGLLYWEGEEKHLSDKRIINLESAK